MAPVELLFVISRHGVDHGDDGWFFPRANMIKVEHSLDGASLHAPNNGFCLFCVKRLRLTRRTYKEKTVIDEFRLTKFDNRHTHSPKVYIMIIINMPATIRSTTLKLTIAVGERVDVFENSFRGPSTFLLASGAS